MLIAQKLRWNFPIHITEDFPASLGMLAAECDEPGIDAPDIYRPASLPGPAQRGRRLPEIPIVEGWKIFQQALTLGSGLARRARYCMSHETGKVEIMSIDDEHMYLRYHQAKCDDDVGRFFICRRDDNAYWLDQLDVVERVPAHA